MFDHLDRPAPAVSRPEAAAALRAACAVEAGAARLAALGQVDVALLDAADRVDHLVAVEQCAAWLEMVRARALVAVTGTEPRIDLTPGLPAEQRDIEELSVETEVACALRIPPRTAAHRIEWARRLAGDLAAAVPLMRSGSWHRGHLEVAHDELTGLDPQVAVAALAAAVEHAGTDTPDRLRRRLRTVVAALDADAAARRIRRADARRHVELVAERDLQGRLTVRGPWGQVSWIRRVADRWARREQRRLRAMVRAGDLDPAQVPTLDALRADAVVEGMRLLAQRPHRRGGSGADVTAPAARTEAIVMVPAATLLGLADDPGVVPGYGPIPAPLARELAASADTWRRFLLDDGGRVRATGSSRYTASPSLRDLVTARDPRCTLEPCARPCDDADLDHLENFDGTNTVEENLHPPCRRHHRLKTFGRWHVARGPEDLVVWISPHGHRYPQHPEPEWALPPPASPAEARLRARLAA